MTTTCKKCGGPATPIVGTFSVCPKCDGAAAPSGRGEPGHVEMCACKRCQIRREVAAFQLVGTAGEVIACVPWDGRELSVNFRPKLTGTIAHWRALDADGKRVGEGVCEKRGKPCTISVSADPLAGDCKLHLQWIFDKLLALSVTADNNALRDAVDAFDVHLRNQTVAVRLHYRGTWRAYDYEILVHQ